MKFKLKAVLAVVLAAIMALAAVPVSALPRYEAETPKAEIEPYWTVPAGYNEHDYNKCVEFLEQTDANGVKNGRKLSESYDPNDPETWGTYNAWDDELQQIITKPSFIWTSAVEEQRISEISTRGRSGSLYGCLDVSGCTALTELDCSYNKLTELDVTGCTALEYLKCSGNNYTLTELDVTGCTALEYLDCGSNDLTELDVSQNTALEYLNCGYNNLTELDVSQNTALTRLDCSDNDLTELDVTQNTALEWLGCSWNSLTELDVTHNTALESLSCSSNSLTELDVTHNTALEYLSCYGNDLTELDVTQNTALEYLNCVYNNLTELDVTQNTALTYLFCASNNLTELDVTQNTALSDLDCAFNNLTELDLSNNPHLILNGIRAEGRGFIGYVEYEYDGGGYDQFLYAYPVNGASFEGFYDENGALISEGYLVNERYRYSFGDNLTGTVIARFSGGSDTIPGDLDGNGSVTTADAIIALRLAMQLVDGSGLNMDAADMDGNGSVTLADAILIMRTAMGLA